MVIFKKRSPLSGFFGKKEAEDASELAHNQQTPSLPKWSFGVLNDKETVEVPGSVLLLANDRNAPLGLHHARARTSVSSFPTDLEYSSQRPSVGPRTHSAASRVTVKKTEDGRIILEPQPDDSVNDPLNWPMWRRDAALLALGFYCMIGGGVTPMLAAGFGDVSREYDVPMETVALTAGLCMLGLGVGSVLASPTAILYGKRPVYIVSACVVILSSIWCALSPSFASLVVARIVQGWR
ncbi:unnamed protein product [Parascedosporium putredinis]|uniref:Major facilitator superfamily (MFS) profile domain-containing protein n=1 Tax=Parascedosporium putredinis TaxID=1442378 RepID=A0A9P1MGT1_9PEZI|nr:unnamed protein product [Parascedosporium putredinis]CAI8005013.1 unnamed protein product [Parascedosporium putredinis]